MSTEELFSLSAGFFLLGAIFSVPGFEWFGKKKWPVILANLAGIFFLMIGFAVRWVFYVREMAISWWQAFPVSTFYESSVFLCLLLGGAALFIAVQSQKWMLCFLIDALVTAIILGLNLTAVSSSPVLFLPSLKSGWLVAHVTLSFVAYGFFAFAALAAIAMFWSSNKGAYSDLIRRSLVSGFLIFTVGGLIFGAVWAQNSWGRFWAWDPKETWAFITWCAYAFLLHLDFKSRLSPAKLGGAAIANFGIVVFTFVGVSILFAGLHSYASLTPSA